LSKKAGEKPKSSQLMHRSNLGFHKVLPFQCYSFNALKKSFNSYFTLLALVSSTAIMEYATASPMLCLLLFLASIAVHPAVKLFILSLESFPNNPIVELL